MQRTLDDKRMKNLERVRPKYQRARDKVTNDCGLYLSSIKRRFDQFFTLGIRPEFASRLETYKSMGVIPAKKEIELLCEDACSFAERQALKAFIVGLGKSPVQMDEQGNPIDISKNPAIDLTDYERYGLDSVDIDSAYRALDDFRDSVELMINHYCNGDKYIYSLTGNDAEYDAGNGKMLPTDAFIFCATNATNFFDSDKDKAIRDNIDRINALTERTTGLTPSESDLLHSLFAPFRPSEMQLAVQNVYEKDPRLASLIEVSEDYRKYIE